MLALDEIDKAAYRKFICFTLNKVIDDDSFEDEWKIVPKVPGPNYKVGEKLCNLNRI